MSEVANKDLCAELYELSGWKSPQWWKMAYPSQTHQFEPYVVSFDTPEPPNEARWGYQFLPAYDLGYLLRKLPKDIESYTIGIVWDNRTDSWRGEYGDDELHVVHADTPENAACLLAIELFKQGILTKESK